MLRHLVALKSGLERTWGVHAATACTWRCLALCAIKGTREIRVILYAKDDPFCASAPADELSIEDILAVEHDMGLTCSSRERSIPLATGSHWLRTWETLPRLPVDDARQDQVQAASGVHLLPQLAGVDPATPSVKGTCRVAQNLPRSCWRRA
jgi:hypothetical protein